MYVEEHRSNIQTRAAANARGVCDFRQVGEGGASGSAHPLQLRTHPASPATLGREDIAVSWEDIALSSRDRRAISSKKCQPIILTPLKSESNSDIIPAQHIEFTTEIEISKDMISSQDNAVILAMEGGKG